MPKKTKPKSTNTNDRLKPLLPPDLSPDEMAEIQSQPGQVYRYGPFVVISDHIEQSTAMDVDTEMSITMEGTLEDMLKRLDAMLPFYPEQYDDAPDSFFYPALSEMAYQFEVIAGGEMLMEMEMEEDDEDDYEEDDDFDPFFDDPTLPPNIISFRPPNTRKTDD